MTREKIRRKHSFDYLFENLGEEVPSRSEQSIYDLAASVPVWSVLPKGIRIGLYSAYTSIEIDIPRKVGQ